MVETEFKGNYWKGPLKGNYAAAYGAMDSNVQVVTAFPITPQTTVVEHISKLIGEPEFIDRGQNVEYVKMESEHSVMAGLIGASIAGARCFTATSGQGLLYMAEMVHWAAGTRLPLIMTIASRGIAPPWNIWADFSDVINMRDSGVMIQFLSSHEEIYDSIIAGFKVTENHEVLLPLLPAYGGFTLSHTSKPVNRLSFEEINEYLTPISEKGWPHIWMDAERPMMHGNLILPDGYYSEFRIKIHEAQMKAKQVIKDEMASFKKKFGRGYGNGLVEPYMCDDADVILINVGTVAKQAEDAVDQLRAQGYKAGALRLRTYRPFPSEEIIEYAKKVTVLGVVDKGMAYGNPTGGPISTDVMAVCNRSKETKNTQIVPFNAGLGGRSVSMDEIMNQFKVLFELKETGELRKQKDFMFGTYWTGLLEQDEKEEGN